MGRGATHERRARSKVVVIFVLVLSGWVQQFVRLFVISGTRVNSRRRKLDQTHVRISRQKRRKSSHFGLTSIGFYQHNQQTLNRLPPNTHTPSHNQTRQILANFLPRGTDETFPRIRVRRKVPFNRQPVAMIRQKSRWISHFFAEKSVASRSKQKSSFQSVPRRASIFQQRPINNSLHYQLGGGRFSGRKQSRRLF